MLVATYPTKKKLKESVGEHLLFIETSLFGAEYKTDGVLTVVGPGAYDRKWFANITMEGGIIKKVK